MSFAKLEFFNPISRSIKDRTALGILRPVPRVYEASSGNTAIALAGLSNLMGLRLRAFLPKNTPAATRLLLELLGAEVVTTDSEVIDLRLVERVEKEAQRDGALHPNQYLNEANFLVHRETGREIAEQLESIGKEPGLLIAGVGTSGHIAGIGSYLKERYGTRVVGVVPAEGERIPGIKRPLDQRWLEHVDDFVEVTLENAISGIREVARLSGILVGLSSGAVYWAMKELSPRETTVLVFPDDVFKYLELIGTKEKG